MDDGLVLNLATEDEGTGRVVSSKKGGRWTARLKEKRSAKRKARPEDQSTVNKSGDAQRTHSEIRAAKRRRTETVESDPLRPRQPVLRVENSKPQGQIISSLFSKNPKVDIANAGATSKAPAKPSNAPLGTSTFPGLGLDPLLTTHLSSKMSITRPTSVQRAALPYLLSHTSDDTSKRDIFIQSQTGSGKTLSFLLPIIQDLLPLSSHSYIDRSIGTLAIIIAPTRELAKQISDVLEALLQMRLRPPDGAVDETASAARLTRWLVSGLLTGGATRTHEKARIRKGLPILVSTPGRLLDHLQHTSTLDVGKCRWLVLDEADRLMELGFEETISGIIKGLNGRRRLARHAAEEGKSMDVGGWDWDRRRRTILCSATIRDDVQKLAGTALVDPLVIKATDTDAATGSPSASIAAGSVQSTKFTPPTQLAQKYVVVPLKLRLVALVALLRSLLAKAPSSSGTKIIVFMSCTDSVDYHWHLLGGSSMDGDGSSGATDESQSDNDEEDDGEGRSGRKTRVSDSQVAVTSSLLPSTSIFRLHGSLPTHTRQASLKGFSSSTKTSSSDKSSPSSSILLCTSVASRGLDLPLVRAVLQYDLPTEGGATEYVHRVGRTARVGKGGEAWALVCPNEAQWVPWVEQKMQGETAQPTNEKPNIKLEQVAIETVLRTGFGGKGSEYEERATDVQLSFERWLLKSKPNAELARKAFLSHMRAYATHPTDEKHIFHVRQLHMGHLAKAFALREPPGALANSKTIIKGGNSKPTSGQNHRNVGRERDNDWTEGHDGEAERRMQAVVRAQGRLTKQGGVMMSTGASEFQIASGPSLEKFLA